MTKVCRPGDVVLVKFPFSNLETTKQRPALVMHETAVSAKLKLVTIAMITSKVEGLKLSGDVLVNDWQSAGLLHPSLIRLSKVATLDGELLRDRLGALGEKDFRSAQKEFKNLFRAWI